MNKTFMTSEIKDIEEGIRQTELIKQNLRYQMQQMDKLSTQLQTQKKKAQLETDTFREMEEAHSRILVTASKIQTWQKKT
jgi:hypothetical protein